MLPTAAAMAVATRSRNKARVATILSGATEADLQALAICLSRYVDLSKLLNDAPAPFSEYEFMASACSLVAPRFGTTVEEMRSSARSRHVTEARMIAVYAARLSGMSYVAMGRYLNKDHTTAMYAYTAVGERPRLREIALEIARQLGWNREVEAVS